MTSVSYETAVYVEDVDALTAELVAVINKGTEHITDERIRNAVIGAALVTAAQVIDGIDMPQTCKLCVVTGPIRRIVSKWACAA
jgi:hypothetical protein